MQKKLPKDHELRTIIRFAFLPVQGRDREGNPVKIWLEKYYQQQTACYYLGRFCGWKTDYLPLAHKKGVPI